MNNRDFTAEYIFHEYPKWVTLADGSQIIANSADEEAVLTGPVESADEREQLLAEAEALGLKVHHKSGIDKLRQMIAEAKA